MRASLKLRLSILIHIETSKGVNFAIGHLIECFLGLNHVYEGLEASHGCFIVKEVG